MRLIRERFRHYNLRTQMIVAFLLVAFFALSFLAYFYIQTIRTALLEQGNQALFAAASRTAISLEDFIHSNLDSIRAEATLPAISTYMSLPDDARVDSDEAFEAHITLDRLRDKDLFYIASYGLLDKNGRNVLDTASSNVGNDEGAEEYFQQPYQTGLPYVSPVKFADSVGGVYFYFSSPVRNEIGQIVGVIRAQYSIAVLQELVSESAGIVGEDSFAILIDENTLRLANDAEPETIFKTVTPLDAETASLLQSHGRLPNLPLTELSTDLPEFSVGLQNSADSPFFAADIYSLDGTDALNQMAVVSLTNRPWWVIYTQPQATFLVPIQNTVRFTLVWTLMVALMFIVAAIIVGRWLTDPIAHLTAVADEISDGNLNAQAEITSSDEIGRLALAFNNMTTQLRQTLEGLEKREVALEESNQQLETALSELKDAQSQMIQQERVAAVGQLAAGIAHDFNNILISITLSADMLQNSIELSGKDREKIEIIQEQSKRAADLTQQILDFSRRSVLKRKDINLGEFLESSQLLLRRTLPENIHLSLYNTKKRYIVNADTSRLQQVVLNLAINARNAMPDGGELLIDAGRLTVAEDEPRPLLQMTAGHWVHFSVSDNGVGIPEEQLEHIFEPFFTTRAPLGSGLGLSQVDGIVKQLGGHIGVETEVGYGTKFTIYLPEVPDKPLPTIHQSYQLQIGFNETILLVEDDDLVRESLALTLQELNYKVLTVKNGYEALLIYGQKQDDIDLIITDLVMPEMGGEQLLQRLKEQNSQLKAIVLTGYPLADDPITLQTINAVAWCQKPVTMEQLSQTIARALDKQPIN